MAARSVALVSGSLGVVLGAAATWMIHPTPAPEWQRVDRPSSPADSAQVLDRLDEITHRLASIDSSLAGNSGGHGEAAGAVPTATRTDDNHVIKAITEQITSLRDELRSRTAGLQEVQASKPEPDLPSLVALHKEYGSDWKRLRSHVLGMSYIDVVRSYGSPTEKFPILKTSRLSRLERWLWEPPDAAFDFSVTFSLEGVAMEAAFSSPGSTRRFLEETGKE